MQRVPLFEEVRKRMKREDLDSLRTTYKASVEKWVSAIQAEEGLAAVDHSITAMERWDASDFTVQSEGTRARDARDRYKEALREANYGF